MAVRGGNGGAAAGALIRVSYIAMAARRVPVIRFKHSIHSYITIYIVADIIS